MQPLQQLYIAGSKLGLRTDVKPFMLPNEAFSTLENAYVWRDRVKKREGLEFFGRLKRVMTGLAFGNYAAGILNQNIISFFSLEANASIQPGSLIITTVGTTVTDLYPPDPTFPPDGTIYGATGVPRGTINYATGDVSINAPAAGNQAATIAFNYYPSLPVMGIRPREIKDINDEQQIFFDTTYAYINASGLDDDFQEFIPGTTWSGGDADFFWSSNYRGSNPYDRLFFVTNFNNGNNVPPTYDPIRYTDGNTWTDFAPLVSATDTLFQARIIIPYYGRLLALNTWEGTTAGGATLANNFFSRCRFSQIGDPTAVDAWRSDQFGKGGFIDAPIAEEIVSAIFFKNTLIVGFESSTWQLRYVGEYGLPFIWERISSDFGCESQFSTILFDNGVLQVGDKAIVSSNSVNVVRIDEAIPDTVFSFRNDEHGNARVYGVRDFQKELVYWTYVDTDIESDTTTYRFPNKSLVYNYRNNTYAKFRNNITCYGTYQSPTGITWDRTDILWDDYSIFWDNSVVNAQFPDIVSGNQQGFISFYNRSSIEEPTLFITDIDLTATPVRVTSPNHNLMQDEWIKITGALFTPEDAVASAINGQIFTIVVIDSNTFDLYYWDSTNQVALEYTNSSLSTYIGNGQITLLPKLDIQTKDFNPFQEQGAQIKTSYVDLLMDTTLEGVISINLIVNSSSSVIGNLLVGNTQTNSTLSNFYVPGSEYAWHRFFATSTGQYIRIQITYNDDLMSTASTHTNDLVINALSFWVRPGSRNIF